MKKYRISGSVRISDAACEDAEGQGVEFCSGSLTINVNVVMRASDDQAITKYLEDGLRDVFDKNSGDFELLRLAVVEEPEPTGHRGNSPRWVCNFALSNGRVIRQEPSAQAKEVLACPDCECSPCECYGRRKDEGPINDR